MFPIGIGIAVGILLLALALILLTFSSRYRKVGPDEVLVISGRKRRVGNEVRGFRIVRNGGTFVVPILESAKSMSLHVISVDVKTHNAISKDGVPLAITGTALFKVSGTDEGIINAAERYLGRKSTDIERDVQSVLEGHLRGVCGQLTPEEIYRDRQSFQRQIADQAQAELTQLGIDLDTLVLQAVSDEQGYLDALGKRRTAEVLRDARMGVADANREASIREYEAKQASETRQAETQTAIADANKKKEVLIAQYQADVAREKARAEQAPIEEQARAQRAVADARRDLAVSEAAQVEQKLIVDVIRPAENQKERVVIQAEGEAAARIKHAEGEATAKIRQAEGEADARLKLAQANAQATEIEGKAAASVIQAKLTAEAEGERQKLLAAAEGEKQKLLAEAEGLRKKAEAMKEFTDATMGLEIAKEVVRVLPDMVSAAAEPLSHVKDIRLLDFGGNGHSNGGKGQGPINKLLDISPAAVARADEALKATTGYGVMDLVSMVRSGSLVKKPDDGEDTSQS